MKTINVKTTKKQANNNMLAVMKKVSVNPSLTSFKNRTMLSIRGYEIREWLEYLTGSKGIYFMEIPIKENSYSLHYSDHASTKLMSLDCHEEDTGKESLEALLFDLSLFPDEPILTFDSDTTEKQLRNLSNVYYEHARTIDAVIERLVN